MTGNRVLVVPTPDSRLPTPESQRRRPHVVILGGGFAGLKAASALRTAPVDVTLLDRTNHHVFQPLLYQVATAVLAPTDITSPIRWLLRKQRNTTVLMSEVRAIDANRRVVVDTDGVETAYDFLIVATGARHSYFGHGDWEKHAPGLKTIEDAREIRHRFLLAFEEAEKCDDPAARDSWLTFVIVGGGPTGVELAGMLPGIAREAMRRDFRRIDTASTRVILLEAGPRLLTSFTEELSAVTRRDLEELGVTVRTGSLVTAIDGESICVGDERIGTRTVFWAAGNAASPLLQTLDVALDKQGRAIVEKDLSVPGRPEVFVVGDASAVKRGTEQLVPGVAAAAMQEGICAAKNIVRSLRGEPRLDFVYRNKGDLATIGRHKAIADFGWLKVTGRLAWWFWLFVHILYLAGFRNRLSVLLEWAYSYFAYRRGARLITREKRV